MNINYVVLGGNLTRTPEVRYLQTGTAVVDFTIANNRKYKAGDGYKEEVSFIGCTAFGRTAENIARFFDKGSGIIVEGRIKTETWKDRDDNIRSKTKVVVNGFHFVGSKKPENPVEPKQEDVQDLTNMDDIPF